MEAGPVVARPECAGAGGGRRVAVIQAAVSLVAVAAVVWWALGQEAPALPRTFGAGLAIVLATALYAVATAARGERWHRILDRSGIALARADSYRLTTVGYMGNNVLPARGGDLLRVFLLGPLVGVPKRSVLGTVIAERLLDAVALALIFAVVAVGVLPDVAVPGGSIVVVAALTGGALLVLLAVPLARRLAAPRAIGDFIRPVVAATRNLASVHGAALVVLSLALWTLEALVYFAVSRSVAVELDVVGALYLVALTNLFALVPAAPGYVGTFDAAVLFGLRSLGEEGSDALAYLLVLRFVLFVPITLVGLAFLVTRYGGWSRFRAVRLGPRGA